jgi:hypothetical protein
MRSFTYQYKGETVETLWAVSVEKGDLRYKVKLGTDLWRWEKVLRLSWSKGLTFQIMFLYKMDMMLFMPCDMINEGPWGGIIKSSSSMSHPVE